MSTIDIVAVVVAVLVTAFVCVTFVARTRNVPPSSRSAVALGVAAGLSALVVVVAVPVIFSTAGQGDPLGTPGAMLDATVRTLVRPVTIIVTVLAFDAGFFTGWVRMRKAQRVEP